MSTLLSLVPEDVRCSPHSTISHPLSSGPTRGQVQVLLTMVSLVVVHSAAIALYVLGG